LAIGGEGFGIDLAKDFSHHRQRRCQSDTSPVKMTSFLQRPRETEEGALPVDARAADYFEEAAFLRLWGSSTRLVKEDTPASWQV